MIEEPALAEGLTQVVNPGLLDDYACELLAEEQESRDAIESGQNPGAITGIRDLDEAIGGHMAKGIHVLIAQPGAGKTSLALQIASNCGCPALFVTTEMPRVTLLRRAIAQSTNTFLWKLSGGKLSDDALRQLIGATARKVPMLSMWDVTLENSGIEAEHIAGHAIRLRERFGHKNVLVVMDSVTDWAAMLLNDDRSANASEYKVSEMGLNQLKKLTATAGITVLAISHINRSGQKAEGMDRLFAAKGTGRYEYIAETLMHLERDFDSYDESTGTSNAKLHILKNRHGANGIAIDLGFEGWVQRFVPNLGNADLE